jgi:hypothetical protein
MADRTFDESLLALGGITHLHAIAGGDSEPDRNSRHG